MNRLRNRPVKPGFEKLKSMKTKLFNLRLKVSEKRQSYPWTIKNLEDAISGLKKTKS